MKWKLGGLRWTGAEGGGSFDAACQHVMSCGIS